MADQSIWTTGPDPTTIQFLYQAAIHKSIENQRMSISLTEDVKTVAEFEKQPREIRAQIHRTGRPIVVTVKGKPDLVVMDAATFERRLKALNLAQLLLEAETSVAAGKVRPAAEFFKEFKRAKKLSG